MLWLLAAPALASGYYYIDSGARGIGRGGAFIVGADDLSAQYYNPAALANIERPMLNLQGWRTEQQITFDRTDEEGLAFDPVENTGAPMYEPSGGYATHLGGLHPALKNTHVAIGVYAPTAAANLSYDEEGAQRYHLKSSSILQGYAGPSVAQRITPWLTLGVGLQYTFLSVEQSLDSAVCLRPDPDECADVGEDPANDLSLSVKNADMFSPSFNAGFIVTPHPMVSIGGAVQPPISYDAPGTLTTEFSEDFILAPQFKSTTATDDDTRLLIQLPLIARFGVQVTPIEAVRVELAGTYTGWSVTDQFVITDMDVVVERDPDSLLLQEDILVTDDVVFKTGFQDAFSVRLGGDWQIRDWVQVRAGGHYETSAFPEEWVGVLLSDAPKFGVGAGATFTIADRVAIDVGGAYQGYAPQNIDSSEITQQALWTNATDPSETAVVSGKVVGNGTITSSVTYVAIGASVYFGRGTDALAN
jgi:long-chain fatty acid transport protein